MKRIGYWLAGRLPPVLCAVLLIGTLTVLTPAEWRQVGEKAAVFAVGLQHPKEGVLYAVEHQGEQDDTAPTVPASSGDSVLPALTTVIPPKGDGGGAVVEEHIQGTPVAGAVAVKNSSGVTYDLEALLNAGSPLTPLETEEPQVLIVHTHATESYMSYYAGYYNADDESRTTDTSANVVAVGEVIAQELRACGIRVIHDTTLHDSPAYSGAYDRSAKTVQQYLDQYPSIQVVLDIHRDAMIRDDLTKIKPTATVEGGKAAQMMIIVGGTDTEELPNPHCKENLQFALQLHQAMESAHSGIMRPLYLVNARYNQGLTAGSLLVEVGTDANTLSEALYSGRLLGKQLAKMLS